MKKAFFLLLVCAICCSAVFSMGSGEKSATSGGKVIEITFWHRTSDNFQKEISSFQNLYPNIKIISEAVGKDYDTLFTKYMAAAASNSLPNVAMLGQRHGIPQLYDSGKLVSIDSLMSKQEQDEIFSAFWDRFTYNGKRVAAPFQVSTPALYYNATMLKEKEVSVPQTLEECVAAAKKLTVDTNGDGKTDVYGFNFNSDTPWYIQPWAWDYGANIVQAKNKVSVDNAGYKKTFEQISRMVHTDKSMPANQHNTSQDDFTNGYTALFLTSCASLDSIKKGVNDKFELGMAFFPAANCNIGGNALGIFKSDSEKEKASWLFIQYLLSPEGMYSGIEKGYLPISNKILANSQIQELIKGNKHRQTANNQIPRIKGQEVNVADSVMWQQTIDILSKVEASPAANISELLTGFQKEVDKTIKDYY